jgi:hypothetical protein
MSRQNTTSSVNHPLLYTPARFRGSQKMALDMFGRWFYMRTIMRTMRTWPFYATSKGHFWFQSHPYRQTPQTIPNMTCSTNSFGESCHVVLWLRARPDSDQGTLWVCQSDKISSGAANFCPVFWWDQIVANIECGKGLEKVGQLGSQWVTCK